MLEESHDSARLRRLSQRATGSVAQREGQQEQAQGTGRCGRHPVSILQQPAKSPAHVNPLQSIQPQASARQWHSPVYTGLNQSTADSEHDDNVNANIATLPTARTRTTAFTHYALEINGQKTQSTTATTPTLSLSLVPGLGQRHSLARKRPTRQARCVILGRLQRKHNSETRPRVRAAPAQTMLVEYRVQQTNDSQPELADDSERIVSTPLKLPIRECAWDELRP